MLKTVYGPSKESTDKLRDRFGKALKGTPEDVWMIVDEVAKMGGERPADVQMPDGLYHTPAHRKMVDLLWYHTQDLNNDYFYGVNGGPCRTIVGAKGIGKSAVFQAYTTACSIMYPDVVCVLITYSGYGREGDLASAGGLAKVVATNLKARKFINAEVPEPCLAENLPEMLDDTNLRLFILVDEIDDLYRAGAGAFEQNTREILGDLSRLGDQTTGLFAVFLCGSSANIPMLISKNSAAEMMVEFPVLQFSSNLNGTKFRDEHLPSTLPVDIDHITELLGKTSLPPQARRLVAFFTGTTPRNIDTVSQARSSPDRLSVLAAEESYLGANTLSSDKAKCFLNLIQEKLYEKNRSLIDSFIKDGKLDLPTVLDSPWEKAFKPLTFDEVKTLHKDAKLSEGDFASKSVFNDLCRLHFAAWIILDGVEQAVPRDIYPIALFQLVKAKLSSAERNRSKEFFTKAFFFLAKKVKDVSITEWVNLIKDAAADTGVSELAGSLG